MKLIGLAGKKQSGKDTAATILVSHCGYSRFRFADLLKGMIHTLLLRLGVDPTTALAMVDGDLKEMPVPQLCGKTTRWAMQTLGTEWGRECIGRNFWVQATLRNVTSVDKAVISDVRFANEAQAVREAGGKIIRIERDSAPNEDTHASEAMDFEADYTILNNSTMSALADKLLKYEKQVYERRN